MNETLLVLLYENLSQDRKDMLQEFLVKAYTQSEFMNLQLQAEHDIKIKAEMDERMRKFRENVIPAVDRHFPCDVIIERGDEE